MIFNDFLWIAQYIKIKVIFDIEMSICMEGMVNSKLKHYY